MFSLKSEGHSLGILKWKSVVLNKLSFTDFYPAGLRWVDRGKAALYWVQQEFLYSKHLAGLNLTGLLSAVIAWPQLEWARLCCKCNAQQVYSGINCHYVQWTGSFVEGYDWLNMSLLDWAPDGVLLGST